MTCSKFFWFKRSVFDHRNISLHVRAISSHDHWGHQKKLMASSDNPASLRRIVLHLKRSKFLCNNPTTTSSKNDISEKKDVFTPC